MKTIVLKIAPPLQSWGTSSYFETRHTDAYPSKSGILGLIAASLGYRRRDTRVESLNDLYFAVRIDKPGTILRDFHTATRYKANGDFDRNYVTNRYYLQDAVFLVFLSGEDQLMYEIQDSLKKPIFPLYAGRRSNPLNFDYFQGIYEEDIQKMVHTFPLQGKGKIEAKYLDVYGDRKVLGDKELRMRQDYVNSFDPKHRQLSGRQEAHLLVSVLSLSDLDEGRDHDPFLALGGSYVSE